MRMTIAALDLGRSRIGVAVNDAASMGAHPVGIVELIRSFSKRIGRQTIMLLSSVCGEQIVWSLARGRNLSTIGRSEQF